MCAYDVKSELVEVREEQIVSFHRLIESMIQEQTECIVCYRREWYGCAFALYRL